MYLRALNTISKYTTSPLRTVQGDSSHPSTKIAMGSGISPLQAVKVSTKSAAEHELTQMANNSVDRTAMVFILLESNR